MKICIIDDNEADFFITKENLDLFIDAELIFFYFESYDSFFEKINNNIDFYLSIDCLIIDYNMPLYNGIDIISKIVFDGGIQYDNAPKIFLLSGEELPEEKKMICSPFIDGFLVKGLNPTDFIEMMKIE